MKIKKQFAPITITIDSEEELNDLKIIKRIAQDASYRSIGGFFSSPPKHNSTWLTVAHKILDL